MNLLPIITNSIAKELNIAIFSSSSLMRLINGLATKTESDIKFYKT
jgi:hypothetical protein